MFHNTCWNKEEQAILEHLHIYLTHFVWGSECKKLPHSDAIASRQSHVTVSSAYTKACSCRAARLLLVVVAAERSQVRSAASGGGNLIQIEL